MNWLKSISLIDLAVVAGNEPALKWFQYYILEKNPACEDDYFKTCFTTICKIGVKMDKNYRMEWLDFKDFADFIKGIIDDGVNGWKGQGQQGQQWDNRDPSDRHIEDLDDVGDWVEDLCGGLT